MKKLLLLLLPLAILFLSFLSQERFLVTGKIIDENAKPIPFAAVVERGAGGVAADANGSYQIYVKDKSATLEISAPGFTKESIKVNGRSTITTTLKASSDELAEVIVTSAYATKRNVRSMSIASPAPGRENFPYQSWSKADDYNTEDYDNISENAFHKSVDNPLSTFSIDVDAASYSNVRRMLRDRQMPPAGAVRIEEMINYFQYNYPQPVNDQPFSFTTEISEAPWNKQHRLVVIGMQGKKIPTASLPASNLVFLIDVSGSMQGEDRLELVKGSLKMLTEQMREQDQVSIVVYAGAAGVVLPSTSGANKIAIKDALGRLEAGGSTAGGAGIKLAYKIAGENFKPGGNNRVILCTDGDFNVGASSDDDMERLIEKERESGVFLTVLGYGMGNYKDNKMQKLADKGNGNHAYIDGMSEAKKVLVNEFGGTLFTIAKDVKLQVEFNPAKVQGYRLIGYENRMLKKEDFNDDKKDAGEMGSGHTVTAIYEIIPAGTSSSFLKDVDKLKYSKQPQALSKTNFEEELMTIKFRYKAADGNVSKLIEHAVKDKGLSLSAVSDNFRFAAAVAEFGMLLRNSEFKSSASYSGVLQLAKSALANDKEGYRKEFVEMVAQAQSLAKKKAVKENDELAGNDE
ncbi:MAG: DUF3520 domain-containing protein [Chitinophagaceae bacterium]|nr:MAG: DUF3520 domain-containing protein [Chitinophagaceae bacterium]